MVDFKVIPGFKKKKFNYIEEEFQFSHFMDTCVTFQY